MNKQKYLLMILIFSGIGIIIMTLFMVFGSNENDINKAELIKKANQMYKEQKYEEAIDTYNQVINTNGGSYNDSDLYMAIGNAYYRQGLIKEQKAQDPKTMQMPQTVQALKLGDQVIKAYEQSLNQYRLGIKNETNNLDIKFNYEFVKKQLDELKKEQEKNRQNQDNQNDQKKDNDQDGQEQQENQESKENNKENQDNNSEQNQNSNNQEQNKENQQSQQNENDQDENQDNENNQNQGEKDDHTKDEEDQGGKESQANDVDEKVKMDEEAIQQILKMLEQKEKESLKNNQAIINHGKEETYDW